MVRKKHSGEADQLILASGGIEHAQLFSIAISWDIKMSFSLYANMANISVCMRTFQFVYERGHICSHAKIPLA